jgi:large subunit ribosomal protein L10
MNKEQKAERVAQIAEAIRESEAIFAIDYRGISVPQAAELRTKLIEAGARFSVVKNTLTERAVDEVGADTLKELLEGPTAFTFVPAEGGDVAMAAKALSQFRRANEVLEFKGGIMGGEALSIEQIESIAKLPAMDVLQGQMVGILASPITGLVRGLNQLIGGLAIALGQIQAEGKIGGEAEEEAPAAEEEAPAAEEEAPAEETPAAEEEAPAEETPAEEAPGDPGAEAETAETETETEEAPSEGEEKEG